MCEDGPLIFQTARKEFVEGGYDKSYRLLVALCTCYDGSTTLEEKRVLYETLSPEEREIVRHVGWYGQSFRSTRLSGSVDVEKKE
jgi:hypothetical protein